MDPRWKHPFPALVAGPTCCGKSQFVKRLLESGEEMIDGAPENIIWCYGMYQPAYDEMLKTIPNITFVEGIPSDLKSMIDPSIRNLIVLDDMMKELSNDQRITNLFTKGCHHRNLSVIFILQNIFHRGKELRDMSLNCHYLVLFKSPRAFLFIPFLPAPACRESWGDSPIACFPRLLSDSFKFFPSSTSWATSTPVCKAFLPSILTPCCRWGTAQRNRPLNMELNPYPR